MARPIHTRGYKDKPNSISVVKLDTYLRYIANNSYRQTAKDTGLAVQTVAKYCKEVESSGLLHGIDQGDMTKILKELGILFSLGGLQAIRETYEQGDRQERTQLTMQLGKGIGAFADKQIQISQRETREMPQEELDEMILHAVQVNPELRGRIQEVLLTNPTDTPNNQKKSLREADRGLIGDVSRKPEGNA